MLFRARRQAVVALSNTRLYASQATQVGHRMPSITTERIRFVNVMFLAHRIHHSLHCCFGTDGDITQSPYSE